MDLRRALLLFAVVLGLAALASAVTRPADEDRRDPPPRQAQSGDARDVTPSASEAPSADHATIELSAQARPKTRRLAQGRPATLVVSVDTPGQVEVPRLGLVQSAEPLTPARFDVLVDEPGTYEVVLSPAAPSASRTTVGALEVIPTR